MVASVTEGEEKPLKYPLMFRACELVLVNKVDLLPHLDIDVDKLLYNIGAVNPDARDDPRQRQDGGGDRRVAGVADRGRAHGGSPTHERGAAHRRRRGAAQRGQRGVLRRRGRAPGTAVSPHGRALRARRAPRGLRALTGCPQRRAARRRRVRPPGDRRQARAAGGRRWPGRAGRSSPRRCWWSSPTTSRSPSAPTRTAARRPRPWRWPASAAALTVAFAPAGAEWEFAADVAGPVDPPGARRDRSTTCCGSSCTSSSTTAACWRAATQRRTPRRRRVELPLSVPGRAARHDLEAVVDDVRRSVLAKAARGRRAARADADREPRRAARRGRARCARGSTPAAGCWRSATAARPPTRWTSSPTSATRRPALAGAPRARPHRGSRDPHRDRQRHRRRGDLRPPGDRPRARRATCCWRSRPAATRPT